MQIYTKIFIGMAVGIVAGFVLGPRSMLLEPDSVLYRARAPLALHALPGSGDVVVSIPKAGKRRRPVLLSLLAASDIDRLGKRYYKVQLSVDEHLTLLDEQQKLRAGTRFVGWVRSDRVSRPVSAVGVLFGKLVDPIGMAFLRLIMMVVVPLVFASLLVGVASLGDPKQLGRLGGKTLGYFLVTTAIAISIGLAAVNVLKPGRFVSPDEKARLIADYAGQARQKTESAADKPTVAENLLSLIPKNPVRALAQGEMLQIIFFAAIFGMGLILIDRKRAMPVITFFEAVNETMVKIVDLVMKLAPYGVLALVAQVVGNSGLGVLKALLAYSAVVLFALFLHAALVYTPVVRFAGKVSMLDFWRAIRPAQLLAFSTSSSSATLPVTMDCAQRRLGVSNRVSSFVLPIGATVNMDGTALYQGVAAVFIAQVFDIPLSLGQQLGIVFTATMASVGAAGVPGVGMVTLALVLTAIHVPLVGIALVLGVDRILDMFRTAVNVTGDMSATVLVAATEGETLKYHPAEKP
ncbi:MAG: dicarboxylate/amino acid:cation symporter [Deltaproteobacteria bacterium]|nr:dicarboxylate/amino acid:cation symporter [Deltaproteobacteria bacterium]